jgi:hypothetical protein
MNGGIAKTVEPRSKTTGSKDGASPRYSGDSALFLMVRRSFGKWDGLAGWRRPEQCRAEKRYFGTIELALEFHAAVMAIIRKCEVPDGTTQETDEVVQPGFLYDDDEGEAWDAADWWKE